MPKSLILVLLNVWSLFRKGEELWGASNQRNLDEGEHYAISVTKHTVVQLSGLLQ